MGTLGVDDEKVSSPLEVRLTKSLYHESSANAISGSHDDEPYNDDQERRRDGRAELPTEGDGTSEQQAGSEYGAPSVGGLRNGWTPWSWA